MSESRKTELEIAFEFLGRTSGALSATSYSRLLEIMPCPVIVTNAEGNVELANPRAQTLLRLLIDPKRSAFRLPAMAWMKSDDSALPPTSLPWIHSAQRGETNCEEIAAIFPREDPLWLRVTSTPLPNGFAISHIDNITETRRAQTELQHQFEQIDTFFDTTLDMLSLSNPEGRLIRINPVWERTLGYSIGDILGTRFLDLAHPEDLESSIGALASLRTPADSALFTSRFRRRDGSYRWLEWRATARDGLIYGAARDVTGYKIAEASLRENAEKFVTAFNVHPDAYYISDIQTGCYLEVNSGFERLSGYSREEAVGKNSSQLDLWVDPSDRARFFEILKSKGGVRNFLARLKHRNGLQWWGEINSDPVALGGRPCIISTTRDVTERIQYENNLKESEARFRGIFEQASIGVALLDDEAGKIINSNLRFREILGGSETEEVAVSLDAILHPDDRVSLAQAGRTEDFSNTSSPPREVRFIRRDGSFGHGSLSLRPLESANNQHKHSILVLEDLTQRKRMEDERLQLERQLSRSQRMESLGSLASGVAHDMNNVLGAVMALASANRITTPEETELAEDLDTIVTSCERGRQLVRGLLDFARQDLPSRQPVDLNRLVREQVRMLERTMPRTISIKVDQTPRLKKIMGDPSALSHALMNLCVNAMDAMGDGGTLTIRTSHLDDGRIELTVQDSGHGMTKEVQEKALDPFFTTKPAGKGTGLGLPIVYSTTKAHQGQLEIESEPGHGTRIHLRFPGIPKTDADAGSSDSDLPQMTGLRILLVEDDELIRQTVSNQLRRLQHSVVMACDGREAIEVLDRTPLIDLILLDINMPVMDGYAAFPKLRALRPTIPIILATGRVDPASRELCQQHSHTTLMPKPYNMADLRAALSPYTAAPK